MLKRKPLIIAIAAAGLSMTAFGANAGGGPPPTSLSEICGETITAPTYVDCGGAYETLTENCVINVDPGANLTITSCHVDADGYKVDISGAESSAYSPLTFTGNGSITGASKIDFDFGGDDSGNCGNTVIYASDYEFEAVGSGPKDGKINMKVDCGGIYIYLANQGTPDDKISADSKVSLKTDDGDISIYGGGGNSVESGEDGSIKIEAGGDGVVTIDETVALSAGEIKISSGGGTSVVGGSNP